MVRMTLEDFGYMIIFGTASLGFLAIVIWVAIDSLREWLRTRK